MAWWWRGWAEGQKKKCASTTSYFTLCFLFFFFFFLKIEKDRERLVRKRLRDGISLLANHRIAPRAQGKVSDQLTFGSSSFSESYSVLFSLHLCDFCDA